MKKILSFLLVLLMLFSAALVVNKSLFGQAIVAKQEVISEETIKEDDAFRRLDDGTIIVNTSGLKGVITGYAGPVPLEILIKDGKVVEVRALSNSETPSFFSRASEVLTEWNGLTPDDALLKEVDGVSGATYSSTAIIQNFRTGVSYYLGVSGGGGQATPLKIWIALVVTLAACIIPLFVKNKAYHTVQLIANVVVLGFWAGQYLDYALMLKYISSGFVWPGALVAVAMLIAAFIYPLWGRPQHYCNHICPLGSAQQLIGELCGYKIKLSAKLIHGLDWFRKILWGVLMLLLWGDIFADWMDYELFSAFSYESASVVVLVVSIVFLLLSLVVNRPYCRFVCPTGSLFKRLENIG